MELSLGQLLLLFIGISVIITFLIKKYTKADTYFIISLIKTKKPLPLFDRFARHKKFLDIFANIGLILGFGALSADFLFGRKQKLPKRLAITGGTFVFLFLFLYAADSALGSALSSSSLVAGAFPLLAASFGFLGLSGFTLFTLFLQATDIVAKFLLGVKGCPGVAPLIPGVQIPGVPITPPLHAWISLIIILVVHEGMHGILGRRHKFEIKSTGVLLFGFLPIGAFVEPDEKEIAKGDDEKVLPFLAAGPMANIALMAIAGVVLFLLLAVANPLTESLYPGLQENIFSGVLVSQVLKESSFCGDVHPAPAFGMMNEGDIIKSVNGVAVNNTQDLFSQLQSGRFSEKTFVLDRNGTLISITLTPNELGQFGFRPENIKNDSYPIPESFFAYGFVLGNSIDFIYWLFLLNFLVASVNFLPVNPFDGGRIARILFAPYLGVLRLPRDDAKKLIGTIFLVLIALLFILNALPLFL